MPEFIVLLRWQYTWDGNWRNIDFLQFDKWLIPNWNPVFLKPLSPTCTWRERFESCRGLNVGMNAVAFEKLHERIPSGLDD
jgi:hypothetical protein